MFKQSRLIARQNWTRFLKRNERERNEFTVHYNARSLPARVTFRNAHDQTMHDTMFEVHSLRMHDDLWRAAENDPLGTIYSLAWTLCASLPPPQELIQDPNRKKVSYTEYYANWYPFVLLHRYAMKLRERVSTASSSSPSSSSSSSSLITSPSTTSSTSLTSSSPLLTSSSTSSSLSSSSLSLSENNNNANNDKNKQNEIELFTVEQLVEADRRYIRSFEELKKLQDNPQTLRRLYMDRENEYLTSDSFKRMASATPFGCMERVSASEIVYTENLYDVRRKKRLTNLFKRIESYDKLRDQCEAKLRKIFSSYATTSGKPLSLNCWLLSMLRRDEDTNDFDADYNEENEYVANDVDDREKDNNDKETTRDFSKEYVVYWQYQKSELVWFLLHVLFALNDSVRDDRLNRDLLYYAANHLDRLIECGMCSEHWNRYGRKIWRMYDERYGFAEDEWRKRARSMVEGNSRLETMWKVLSYARVQAQTDPMLPQPDMYMLYTHNSVQGDNVSMRKRLTNTCLQSLRMDYALYALLIEAAIDNREQAIAIGRLSAQRDDLLTLEAEIYLESMIHDYTINPTTARVNPSSVLRKCHLMLEQKSILNTLHGRRL